MKVIFTARAEAQMDALHAYIDERSGTARADGYITRIVDYCLGLKMFPRRGTRVDGVMPGLRRIGFEGRVTIAFVVRDDEVIIEGVFYGGQDWRASFDAD